MSRSSILIHINSNDTIIGRELFAHLIGAEKTAEIKTLKESGATNEELRKKGEELIAGITDPEKKEEAKFYAVGEYSGLIIPA